MTLKIEQAERLPFTVDYVLVTEENMEEAAKWCNGQIRTKRRGEEAHKYIKVEVSRPANVRQTQAFPGDRILHTISGFRVYMEEPFNKAFRKHMVYTEADAADQLVDYPDEPLKPYEVELMTGNAVTLEERKQAGL